MFRLSELKTLTLRLSRSSSRRTRTLYSRDLRLFWNLGRTYTKLDDLSAQPWYDYLAAKSQVWRNIGGNWSNAAYDATRTVESAHSQLIQAPLDDIAASLGEQGGNAQTWRSSLVVTRSFAEGLLRGSSLSANFRYRGPSIIGFPTFVDAKARSGPTGTGPTSPTATSSAA